MMDRKVYGNTRAYTLGKDETVDDFINKLSAQYESRNKAVHEPTDFEVMFNLTNDPTTGVEKGMYRDAGYGGGINPTVNQLSVDPLETERLNMENNFMPVNPPQKLGEEYNDRMDNTPDDNSGGRYSRLMKYLLRMKSPLDALDEK